MDTERIAELTVELAKYFAAHMLKSAVGNLDKALTCFDLYPTFVVANCRRCSRECNHKKVTYDDGAIIEGIENLNLWKLGIGVFLKLHPFLRLAGRQTGHIPVAAYVCDNCNQVSPIGVRVDGIITIIDIATGDIDSQTQVVI